MTILSQLTRLLSVPPGDLVYHLVVQFAIWAIFLLALGEGRRTNWRGSALRAAIASVGLLILRGALVIVALLSSAGILNLVWVMPPLERFAAVASLGLLAWAFLPWVESYPQAGLVLVVVNTFGAIITYAILAPQWYRAAQISGDFYNSAAEDLIWSVWAAALALMATLTAALRRRAQWGTLAVAFGLLLLGHLLHLFYAEPQTHVAGWVRLAELCAYPMLAGLMLQRASEREELAQPALPAALAASAPWTAVEACQRIAEASNVAVAVQRAGSAIGNVLSADVIAIGVLNKTGDTVDLAAVCHAGASPRSGPAFDVASQPPIQSAINRKRAVLVDVDQEAHRATLAALVGGAIGPLWMQPLVHQNSAVGILIAARFTQRKTLNWTASEQETLNGLCAALASALAAAQTTVTLAQQVDQLQQQLGEREAALKQAEIRAQQLDAQVIQAQVQQRRTLHIPARADRPVEPPRAEEKSQVEPAGMPSVGDKTLKVKVKLDGNTPLKSARAMMVLSHIKRVGRIVACQPVEADLRSGGFADEFTVTFATPSDPASVRSALSAIRDVVSVEVQVI